MKLEDIKINSAFAESVPSEKKIEECRKNWNKFHMQDRYLVVNPNGYLIDGYVMYCILKEYGIEEAQVKISARRKKCWHRKNIKDWEIPRYRNNPTTYIYGIHPNSNCKREFCWRVPEGWGNWADNIQIGDTIFGNTKYGHAPVIVSKIKILDRCPIEFPVKKVHSKRIKKYGWWLNTKEEDNNGTE